MSSNSAPTRDAPDLSGVLLLLIDKRTIVARCRIPIRWSICITDKFDIFTCHFEPVCFYRAIYTRNVGSIFLSLGNSKNTRYLFREIHHIGRPFSTYLKPKVLGSIIEAESFALVGSVVGFFSDFTFQGVDVVCTRHQSEQIKYRQMVQIFSYLAFFFYLDKMFNGNA